MQDTCYTVPFECTAAVTVGEHGIGMHASKTGLFRISGRQLASHLRRAIYRYSTRYSTASCAAQNSAVCSYPYEIGITCLRDSLLFSGFVELSHSITVLAV
jgi:hypothetical protein